MKTTARNRIGFLTAALTSLSTLLHPSTARGQKNFLNQSSSEKAGLAFERILTAFEAAGLDAPVEGVFLIGVHDEDSTVDLQSLDGYIVTMPIDDLVAGLSDSPRNLFGGR